MVAPSFAFASSSASTSMASAIVVVSSTHVVYIAFRCDAWIDLSSLMLDQDQCRDLDMHIYAAEVRCCRGAFNWRIIPCLVADRRCSFVVFLVVGDGDRRYCF